VQCADITFAEPEDVAEVNDTNCFNSSHISFETVFTTSSLDSAGFEIITLPSLITTILPAFLAITYGMLMA
jgi:hypothetical protein